MVIQVRGLAKELPTITALPRPFSSVDFLMLIKRVLATEGFPTFAAVIKLFLIRGFRLVNLGFMTVSFFPSLSAFAGLLSVGKDLKLQKAQYVREILLNIPDGEGLC